MSAAQFDQELPMLSVHAFVGAGNGAGTPAQQAVQAALLQHAGMPFAAQPRALVIVGLPHWAQETSRAGAGTRAGAGGPVYAAAQRLAALPAAARHAWLAATWPRCGPASSPWDSCHDRRRGTQLTAGSRPRPAGRPGPPSPRCGWRGCTWSAAGPRPPSGCWRGSAACSGRRCTGTGTSPAGPPRRS